MARRVRIAVSVFFAVLTVLLCLCWIRSYWRVDRILVPMPGECPLGVESHLGKLSFSIYSSPNPLPNEFHWNLVVIDEGFGNGAPIEAPRLKRYSYEGVTGATVPYRFLVAVCGILALVAAYSFPPGYDLRRRVIARVLVAAILVFIVWLAS